MRDGQLEDRVRAVLRAEGEELPVTITSAELERRLTSRRRDRTGRRLSLSAVGIAAVLVVAFVAAANGWFSSATIGSSPTVAPTEPIAAASRDPEPTGPEPTVSLPVIAGDGTCIPLDVTSADRTPQVVIDVAPPDGASSIRTGQLGAFRLGGRDVGNIGSWDHDTIALEAAVAASWPTGITVLAIAPDTCLIGVSVDAVPYPSVPATTPATAIDLQESVPRRLLGFSPPPVGDWFVRVHAVFETTDGSEAFSETFFRITTIRSAAALSPPAACNPVDPSGSGTPPSVIAGASPGDAMGFAGQTTASLWDGQETGTKDSWALPAEPDWIRVDPELQEITFISDTCLRDVAVEALLTQFDTEQGAVPEPIVLPILGGGGSRVVRVAPPPTGAWAVRVRTAFETTDGSPAWSETLFAVTSPFHAPTLTMRREGGVAVSAAAGCPNYSLASGALSADLCGAPFTVNDAAVRMSAASNQDVELVLSDGWGITSVRATAVDAGLVAAGAFAPEHSVAFMEQGGPQVTMPLALDAGRWIVRLALNGSRGGDGFGAYYDFFVEITP
jgi:hypothetical protein